MKNIDISEYLHPSGDEAGTDQKNGVQNRKRPISDATYSMVLGYGFTRDARPGAQPPKQSQKR